MGQVDGASTAGARRSRRSRAVRRDPRRIRRGIAREDRSYASTADRARGGAEPEPVVPRGRVTYFAAPPARARSSRSRYSSSCGSAFSAAFLTASS